MWPFWPVSLCDYTGDISGKQVLCTCFTHTRCAWAQDHIWLCYCLWKAYPAWWCTFLMMGYRARHKREKRNVIITAFRDIQSLLIATSPGSTAICRADSVVVRTAPTAISYLPLSPSPLCNNSFIPFLQFWVDSQCSGQNISLFTFFTLLPLFCGEVPCFVLSHWFFVKWQW